MVIYYHRVADHTPNGWTISNAQFRREIEWLEASFDLVSLGEAQRRVREGNSRPSVSITFDDATPRIVNRHCLCSSAGESPAPTL